MDEKKSGTGFENNGCYSGFMLYRCNDLVFLSKANLEKGIKRIFGSILEVFTFRRISSKRCKKMSEEDLQSWERGARKSLAEFVPENSVMYERIYEDIRDNFIYGFEDEKKERVKVTTTKIVSVNSCRVTADTADCAILVKETSERYDGTKGETETEYTFRYEKENGKWMIKSFGWNYPGGI